MRYTVAKAIPLLAVTASAWTPPDEYPLFASENGRFFELADGTPFFYQVDTAWTLMTSLSMSDAEKYFADRASKGFNVVQACGAPCDGVAVANRRGDLPFHDFDLTKPSEPYWEYVDSIVELAWSYGIRMTLYPVWGSYVHDSSNKAGSMNTTNASPYGEFFGKRYPYHTKILFGDINPYWANKGQIKKEYAAGGVPSEYEYIDWLPVYNDLAHGIIKGEKATVGDGPERPNDDWATYQPLISIHNQNQWFEEGPLALASTQVKGSDWLTFDVAQSGHSDYPPNPPIHWWNARRGYETAEVMWKLGSKRCKKIPALDNEPHYEGRYNNAKKANIYFWNATDVRTGAWQTAFSGTAGVAYGADQIWYMYDPALGEPRSGGPPIPWYEAINFDGAGQMQHVQNAILDRGNDTYFDRIPADDIIQGDAGVDDKRVKAMRDSGGSWIMVYTPGQEFSIETESLKSCDVEAKWYNPVNGEYSDPLEYSQCDGDGVKKFTPPEADDHVDWVLVLG